MNYNSIGLVFNKDRRMKRCYVSLEGAGAWGTPSKLRELHVQRPCDRKEPGTFDDFREVSVTGGERKTDSQTEGGKEGERKRGEMKQDKIKAWS